MVNHPNRSSRRKAAVAPKAMFDMTTHHDHEADYAALLDAVNRRFIQLGNRPLFQTSTMGLYDLYLANIAPEERQVHDCHACRRFIETYGGMVVIDEMTGEQSSAMWGTDGVPDFYRDAMRAMHSSVRKALVVNVFLSTELRWGQSNTAGGWTHFSVRNPHVWTNPLLTAGQRMAVKREDFKTVREALRHFSAAHLSEALRILDHLDRPDKFKAPLRWLIDRHADYWAAHQRVGGGLQRRRTAHNRLWLAVATAPDGYCHPRASAIGSLLEDLLAGKNFEQVKRAFNAKVGSTVYQRPQAAPAQGNVAEGERIIKRMGLERSLERRFASMADIQVFAWQASSHPKDGPRSGVFGHVPMKHEATFPIVPEQLPALTVTWAKFTRDVLPAAQSMEVYLNSPCSLTALLTAVHPDATPIIRWDAERMRNRVSWYTYAQGSPPSQWGLSTGWNRVTSIVPLPNSWQHATPYLFDGVLFILDGASDTNTRQGNGLFPELLIEELRSVRSTIEAYSRTAEIKGREIVDKASGLMYARDATTPIRLRVGVGGARSDYVIDRWE